MRPASYIADLIGVYSRLGRRYPSNKFRSLEEKFTYNNESDRLSVSKIIFTIRLD